MCILQLSRRASEKYERSKTLALRDVGAGRWNLWRGTVGAFVSADDRGRGDAGVAGAASGEICAGWSRWQGAWGNGRQLTGRGGGRTQRWQRTLTRRVPGPSRRVGRNCILRSKWQQARGPRSDSIGTQRSGNLWQ